MASSLIFYPPFSFTASVVILKVCTVDFYQPVM
jgi:hypothetical protein